VIFIGKFLIMKHILNNLSEQEKNSIREQHKDVIKINTSRFHKLLEAKLGDSKPLLSEQTGSLADDEFAVGEEIFKKREQPELFAQSIMKELISSLEGFGTSLPKLRQACKNIMNKRIYDEVLRLIKIDYPQYNLVMDFIMTDFNTIIDRPNYRPDLANKPGFGADGWDTTADTNTSKFCATMMKNFNEDEWNKGFMSKVKTAPKPKPTPTPEPTRPRAY
jgi:hypothetical protein